MAARRLRAHLVDAIPAQNQGLRESLEHFQAEIIVGDDMIFGVLPMLLGPREARPPVVLCGTSILHWARDDAAPNFVGLPPATTDEQRRQYAVIADEYDANVDQPVLRSLNEVLKPYGVGPVTIPLFHSVIELADAYMQLSVPSFEFPRREALREAVRTVLDRPAYRMRASRMADEFASMGTRSAVLRIIKRLVADEGGSRRTGTMETGRRQAHRQVS